ncbi:hypothetical protein, partial [Rhizobium laguerreae]|uniref:hypothetical protein n=1 Tax=Rhizobium laguerreae TaxID=1076926 RepID=UPI001C909FB5
CLAQDGKDLGFAESARLHQNLLDHKARENSTFEARYFAGGLPGRLRDWLSDPSMDCDVALLVQKKSRRGLVCVYEPDWRRLGDQNFLSHKVQTSSGISYAS